MNTTIRPKIKICNRNSLLQIIKRLSKDKHPKKKKEINWNSLCSGLKVHDERKYKPSKNLLGKKIPRLHLKHKKIYQEQAFSDRRSSSKRNLHSFLLGQRKSLHLGELAASKSFFKFVRKTGVKRDQMGGLSSRNYLKKKFSLFEGKEKVPGKEKDLETLE